MVRYKSFQRNSQTQKCQKYILHLQKESIMTPEFIAGIATAMGGYAVTIVIISLVVITYKAIKKN
jgi:hypothetical protein